MSLCKSVSRPHPYHYPNYHTCTAKWYIQRARFANILIFAKNSRPVGRPPIDSAPDVCVSRRDALANINFNVLIFLPLWRTVRGFAKWQDSLAPCKHMYTKWKTTYAKTYAKHAPNAMGKMCTDTQIRSLTPLGLPRRWRQGKTISIFPPGRIQPAGNRERWGIFIDVGTPAAWYITISPTVLHHILYPATPSVVVHHFEPLTGHHPGHDRLLTVESLCFAALDCIYSA